MKKIISLTLDEDIVEWIDSMAEGLEMSRSEFVNFIFSGGREARKLVDEIVDKWLERKRSEVKARLGVLAKSTRKEAR